MKEVKQKLTLSRPEAYQIKVLGHLDERWAEWDSRMSVTVEDADEPLPVTKLTGAVDQAALQGLLRLLYKLGLPLISVNWIQRGLQDKDELK